MERGSRTKVVTAGVLAVVFGSGVLLGFAADRSLGAAPAEAAQPEADGPRDGNRGRDRDRGPRTFVYEQLAPTEAQQVVIDSIREAQREKLRWLDADFREARRVYRENFDAVIHELREGIAGVFPPEQAEEYRRLLADYDRRRAEERGSRGDRK